jgi:hypothetical protein
VPYRWRSLRIGHFSEVIRGHPKPIEVIRSKNLAHPPIFPSLFEPISEPIQVNPNLSAAIRSNPRILTTKIRTYPRLGEQKSEPIRGYPKLSEAIRASRFFSIAHRSVGCMPSRGVSCHTRLSAHLLFFPLPAHLAQARPGRARKNHFHCYRSEQSLPFVSFVTFCWILKSRPASSIRCLSWSSIGRLTTDD